MMTLVLALSGLASPAELVDGSFESATQCVVGGTNAAFDAATSSALTSYGTDGGIDLLDATCGGAEAAAACSGC